MAATDSDSIHDNMTRLRMRMVQQKLANEREKLQRPETESSSNDVEQWKLQQAMLRRQELLDRIRQEQLLINDLQRPRTYSPRRRYTPTPIPPPSRRSLPDLNKTYQFNWFGKEHPPRGRSPQVIIERSKSAVDMPQVKHVIEHQFRHADPVHTYRLPPLPNPPQHITTIAPQPQVTTIAPPPQVTTIQAAPPQFITQVPAVHQVEMAEPRNKWFNKGDFMDMMMMQNAQMHHMVMQQLMVNNLPGSQQVYQPVAVQPVAQVAAPAPAARPVYHHHFAPVTAPAMGHYQSLPPLDMGGFYPFQ